MKLPLSSAMRRAVCPVGPERASRLGRLAVAAVAAVAAVTTIGCGDDQPSLSIDELMNPESCVACHPKHYQEWSGSMHAYAADDPVFIAMNRRGQEETAGALGDFCVSCHAPMAVRLGLTRDGLNLADVPQWAKGVTCYFCHNIEEVAGEHNNPIVLADDGVMRGGLSNPVRSPAHRRRYSELVDTDAQASSAACGSCHDIVTPAGVHLERTFSEWKQTIFASADPRQHLSCGQCHMVASTDVVADAPGLSVPLRQFGRREHTFAGIDVALTPWPEMAAQRSAIDRDLKAVLSPRLCVEPLAGGQIRYRLDNVGAGHMFPSGAAHDRRAWAEVIAYDAKGAVILSSGAVPDGADPDPAADPLLFGLWDRTFNASGQPAKFFWDVARIESRLLPAAVTTDVNDPRFDHSVSQLYPIPGQVARVARVTARVRIRPLPYALLDELIRSGHLDAGVRGRNPTLELTGSQLEWRPERADLGGCVNP